MTRLLVLGWHNILATPSFPRARGAGARGFARQVLALRRFMNPVPLEPALRALADGGRLPPRAVALTFDDGYRDNLTVAAPILRALGVPATFFLVPGFLEGRTDPWWERLASAWHAVPERGGTLAGWRVPPDGPERRAAVARAQAEMKGLEARARSERIRAAVDAAPPGRPVAMPSMMDADDARELASMGFAIGSHTDTHPILLRETPEVQRRELLESRRHLEDLIGPGIRMVAYPNGSADDVGPAAVAAARDAGYDFGVTTVWGMNAPGIDPLLVRRVLVEPARTLRTLRWDASTRPWRPVTAPARG
jgi:peptidoglycan/xylan/chitin deacetylase (PgdA/CDA1 family)